MEKDELPPQEKETTLTAKAEEVAEVEEVVKEKAVDKEEAVDTEEKDEDTTHHVHGLARLIFIFGLCVVTFLIGLDQLIVATAIPKITSRFSSLEDVGWYGSAYLLCTTSLQPTFGKIYTYFDLKWTYVVALIIFELGSVLCAAATSSEMFIIGRAVAGTGAAGLYGGGMTMVGYAIPLEQRSIFLACMSSMFGIASIVGPILGGAFTDRLSWRWCFWINLPFGAIGLATVIIFFKTPKREYSHLSISRKIKNMDLPGGFFLITGVICLLFALQWGGSTYPWKNSKVWGCLLGFGLLIIVFIALQVYSGEHATIPLHIMKKRTVLASSLTLCCLTMGFYTHVFYLPFYFQSVKGTTAEQSGIRCIPYLISQVVGGLTAGILVSVIGYYTPFLYFGSVLFTIGCGFLYTLSPSSSAAKWIGYQVLTGFGAGTCIQLPFIAVQAVLNAKDMPSGNCIAIFFNTLGGAVAVSIAQNIFSNTLVKEVPKYVTSVDVQTVVKAGPEGFRKIVKPGEVAGTIIAYDKAVTMAFVLAIATGGMSFLTSLLFEWKSIKGKKLEIPGAGA
ncbi:Autophagy-related protein 18 [Venturia nashicola]|nr:Autophagy-related protein 18 [Venturia nashicola]